MFTPVPQPPPPLDPIVVAGHMDAAQVIFELMQQPLMSSYCRNARQLVLDQQIEIQTLRNKVTALQTDSHSLRQVARA